MAETHFVEQIARQCLSGARDWEKFVISINELSTRLMQFSDEKAHRNSALTLSLPIRKKTLKLFVIVS